jgi:hypothetical protein
MATLILTTAALIGACGGTTSGTAEGGLTKEQAVTAATSQAQGLSETTVTFVSAASGRLEDFDAGASGPNHRVWAVTFQGVFRPPSCGPAAAPPHPCPSPNTSLRMFVDYSTGNFVMAEEPAPGRS